MDTRRSGCKTYSLRKIIIHHLSYCVIAWLIYGRGTAEARVLLEAGSRGHFRRYSKRHLLHLDRRVAREREREKILDDCCLLLYLRRSCSNSLSLSSFLFSTLKRERDINVFRFGDFQQDILAGYIVSLLKRIRILKQPKEKK